MALKSNSYILDIDHVKLSLGMESLLHQLLGYTFIFVKNTHQKPKKNNVSANYTCCNCSLEVPWSAIYCEISAHTDVPNIFSILNCLFAMN